MGTNGASARVFKAKKKTKQTWRRDFYRESRFTYRYPFCPEQVFIKKRLEICLKIHFFRLTLVPGPRKRLLVTIVPIDQWQRSWRI